MGASASSIPNRRKRKRLIGWGKKVQTLKQKSIFWTRLWRENGCPSVGHVKEIMLKAKREYKRETRLILRNQERLASQRIAYECSVPNKAHFWKSVRNKFSKSKTLPTLVDGMHTEVEICDIFKAKFNNLYNSVQCNESEIDELNIAIQDDSVLKCEDGSCSFDHFITPETVKSAVRKLKVCKADANPLLSSDHILNACDDMFTHLSHLFNTMLSHCYTPSEMLLSTVVPIPKNLRKSLSNSDNYRSIALGSIIGKVFDYVILNKQSYILQSCNLQFGFKADHSTTQCTFVLQEIIDYYVSKQSACHVVMLDASKAFDRVHYGQLFELLIKRGYVLVYVSCC